MRRAPDPGQGSLFAPAAEMGRSAMDPQIPMANHTFARRDARARVYEAIRQAPAGLTDQEIAATLGLAENSVRPRRLELVERGLVVDSGTTRLTSTGKAGGRVGGAGARRGGRPWRVATACSPRSTTP